jgi:hypothetical protein
MAYGESGRSPAAFARLTLAAHSPVDCFVQSLFGTTQT